MKRRGKRLISFALAVVITVGSVCWKPPKAKAVVIDATAAFGAAAVTAAINGTTATTIFAGMGTSAVTSSVVGLMDTYAVTTGVAASGSALASAIGTGILVAGGTLLVGAAAAALIGGFIDWMREQEGLEAGGDFVLISEQAGSFTLADGTVVTPVVIDSCSESEIVYVTPAIAADCPLFYASTQYYLQNGLSWKVGSYWNIYDSAGNVIHSPFVGLGSTTKYVFCYVKSMGDRENFLTLGLVNPSYWSGSSPLLQPQYNTGDLAEYYDYSLESFGFDPNSEFQEIPEIPEGQILSIDTGLASLPVEDPQAVADAIMQSAIDGALAPTVSVQADPSVQPDPDPEPDPEPEPDSGSTETTGWLSRILESIKALPQQIAEAISSIFVPSPDFFPTAISDLKDAYSDRMGLLTYPISILFDFLDRVVNLNDQPPILRWDNIYLPGYPGTPVVAAGQYNLNDALSTSSGRQVHEIYLVVVDAIMILAFLDLCRRKYQKVIHN